MMKAQFAWLAAALLVSGGAFGQTGRPTAGSAGEAAPAIGARPGANNNDIAVGKVVANPGSFQMQKIDGKVEITDPMMLNSDRSEDWIVHGRTYDNQRFSPFTDINRSNVKQLRPTAIIQTGINNTTEMTPIEVDGVLYLETGHNKSRPGTPLPARSFGPMRRHWAIPTCAAASNRAAWRWLTAKSMPLSSMAMSWRWTPGPAS